MIKRIQQLLSGNASASQNESNNDRIQLACAALLVEVMVIDQKIESTEEQTIVKQLQNSFGLRVDESQELLSLAHQEVRDATSLYQFTHSINKQFSSDEKYQLVQQLWKVAYSDGNLDKHEEATVRRIAELIHLPHSQFIRAKKSVKH